MMTGELKGPVIYFDGVCNLCNLSIQFILRHEKDKKLKFAPLQSLAGSTILKHVRDTEPDLDSLIFQQGESIYTQSKAVFKIASYLKWPYSLVRYFQILPKPLTDLFYRWIARNRYSVFGKRDQCMLPTPELRDRFID